MKSNSSIVDSATPSLEHTPIGRLVKGRAMTSSATILNVDDDPIGRYHVTHILRNSGFNVIEAESGEEALRLISETAPDLVLLDVKLPGIDGIEVCRRLKTDDRTRTLPVLHLSATWTDPSAQARGLESGADGYLVEPVEPIVLVATINALLRARRAEDKLRASQRALDDLFDNAPVGLRLVHADGSILRVNAAGLQLVGLAPDAVNQYLGAHVSMFHTDRQLIERLLVKLAEGATIHDLECQISANDGALKHVLISANGFFEHGQLVHSRWFVRDITDRTLAEEQIRRQSQALARSNADLEDFAYIASHDLKEPLRGIHNYSKFLLEDYGNVIDEEGRRKLETLNRLSRRMDTLIGSLMEYSRVGRTEMAISDTDLNPVVADVIESLHSLLEETGAAVIIPQPLPTVRCDRIRITEILRNLIINGIKYNTSAQPTVEIGSLSPEEAPSSLRPLPGQHTIYINGIGIPERHWRNIFRMFKRLHGRDDYGGGTGSGLAIVQKLVDRHGGRIDVRSTDGEGSTFYITL